LEGGNLRCQPLRRGIPLRISRRTFFLDYGVLPGAVSRALTRRNKKCGRTSKRNDAENT
jgi:hypothetical protein